jgi:antitoxin FitA
MGQQESRRAADPRSKLGIWLWSSHLACIRSPAVAMSTKSPALSQRTREGQGTRFCVGKDARHFAFIASSDSIDSMATLTIRQLDEKTKTRLRVRAAHHGRSMEEEAREILRSALTAASPVKGNLAEAVHRRFAALGGHEVELPRRDPMRQAPEFGE